MSSWDAIEVEDTCAEHQNLHFFTTWLGRQKVKRSCNAQDHDKTSSKNKKEKKGGINETLVKLPLCVLNSTCSSSDDVQKLWRFANIIENGKEHQVNGLLHEKDNFTSIDKNSDDDVLVEVSLNLDDNSPQYQQCNYPHYQQTSPQGRNPYCHHRKSKNKFDETPFDAKKVEENRNESEESRTRHSSDCEFHRTLSEDDENETNCVKLESAVQQINKKLQLLEQKMDAILSFIEKNTSQKS